jgi:hypothetical protein
MWGETLLSYKSPWGLVGRGNHPTCTAKYAHRISARIRQRRTWQQRGRTCSRGTCSLLAGFLAPVALLSGLRWQRGLVKRLLIGGLRFRSTQGIPLHRPPPFPRRAAPPQPPHRRPPLEMAQQVEVRYPGFSAQRGVAVARTRPGRRHQRGLEKAYRGFIECSPSQLDREGSREKQLTPRGHQLRVEVQRWTAKRALTFRVPCPGPRGP